MSVTVVFDPLTVSLLPKQVCWSHLILRYKDQLSRIKMVRKLPLSRNGVNVSVSTVYFFIYSVVCTSLEQFGAKQPGEVFLFT